MQQHNGYKYKVLLKIILVCFIGSATIFGYVIFYPNIVPNNNYQLIVSKDEKVYDIARDLTQHGIIKNQFLFYRLLTVLHKDRHVSAGLYFFKNSISMWSVIKRVTDGKPDQISVTILDGWNLAQIRNYINNLPNIKHSTAQYSDSKLQSILKIKAPNIEGMFYPSTYFIVPNQLDLDIYQQSYRLMQNKLYMYFARRNQDTNYSNPYQLLIMASLIQKETNNKNDMVLVSTVFNNRLRKHMKLQNDPAVFYGLRDIKKVILRKDFQINTPYNTYFNFGLPQTPICTPSEMALLAASNPIHKPELLYFVAIGSGKTKFSATYTEHQMTVNQLKVQ